MTTAAVARHHLGPAAHDVAGRAQRVADEVAAVHAEDVDRRARFPSETIEALRAEHLLGALVPVGQGGLGASLSEVAEATLALARQCASSAMVFAMHHLQVACLLRHGRSAALERYTEEVAAHQLLLASATTEVGLGGKLRASICALDCDHGRFRLDKEAGVVSYGAYADAVLATARRSADSPPSDQVLVVCAPPGLELTQTGDWDTLGLRGTCSPGFVLRAEGDEAFVLSDSFADIAAQTMMPVSHVLWSFVWLGIASAAYGRARAYVQAEARKKPGTTPPGATRLAELDVAWRQLDALARGAAGRYATQGDGGGAMGAAIAFNSLKVGASTLTVEIVSRALAICGMAGYREGTPYSLGRHLRDANGGALMVNNDRILGDNAQMLLVLKEAL